LVQPHEIDEPGRKEQNADKVAAGSGDSAGKVMNDHPREEPQGPLDPHVQVIVTVCDEVLPNIVRIYQSGIMSAALDRDHFVRIIEQKVELARKSLKRLPAAEQDRYRERIDRAYAENIDLLHLAGNRKK
jgi:hypothetical protein